MYTPESKVLIGLPSGSGFIPGYVVDGLYKMKRPCQTSLLIIERQQIDLAINYLIEMAIRLEVDYFFLINDDGILPSNTLELLLSDDKDIVGAPMMTRTERENGKHSLCCFEKFDFYIGDGKTVKKYRSITNWQKDDPEYLKPVDATGGSCLLIKRNCFEALFTKHNGRPYEDIHEVHETMEHGVTVRNLSQDVVFCERAKEEGFQIYIDTRIRPIHLGKQKMIRFQMEGEVLPDLKEPTKCITLSENL